MRCTSIPASISSAAIRCAREPVFSYMKRPVSVISPTYSASAISKSGFTPSPCIRSQTISAVHDARGTTRLTVPKRVLSWWWSMLMIGPGARLSASAGLRSRLPQSRKTIVRSWRSSGGEETWSCSARNEYSPGSGRSLESMYIRLSLPSRRRIRCIATSDPSASPSGFSWVQTISRSAARSASSTASRSAEGSGILVALVEQPGDPHRAHDRLVVFKAQRGRVLELELGGQPRLQKAVRRAQALEAGLHLTLAAEHAHVDAGVAEVGAGLDAGDGHESHARILQLPADRIAEDGAQRLVDASHPPGGHPSLRHPSAPECRVNPRASAPAARSALPRASWRAASARRSRRAPGRRARCAPPGPRSASSAATARDGRSRPPWRPGARAAGP